MNFKCFIISLSLSAVINACESNKPSLSKIVVGLGCSQYECFHNLNIFEVIDISSTLDSFCYNLEPFTAKTKYAVGVNGDGNEPIICTNIGECHSYDQNKWKQYNSKFNESRTHFAMIINDQNELFITGGLDENQQELNSTIRLRNKSKYWNESTPMKMPVSNHCMVQFNSTTVLVIGGSGSANRSTFSFNTITEIWKDGPPLSSTRIGHACSMIRTDSKIYKRSVIAVGGKLDSGTSEILHPGAEAWIAGPALPVNVIGATLTEDPFGGVVLIGGFHGAYSYNLDVYRLQHAVTTDTWEKLEQKIFYPRAFHTAFFIEDWMANCSSKRI